MIKKSYKDIESNYYNILQLIILAILNELMIIATFLGIYNEVSDIFSKRKLVWWVLLFMFLVLFFGSIIFTSGLIWYKLL